MNTKRIFYKNEQKRLRIKICGLSNEEDIKICSDSGVDALGFLVKESKPEGDTDILLATEAKRLITCMPKQITSVLLIKFADIDCIVDLIHTVAPDVVQLQREVDNIQVVKKLRLLFPHIGIIRTFHMEHTTDVERLYRNIDEYAPYIDAINMDSAKGGSGKQHDWTVSSSIAEYARKQNLFIILSGGITPLNIKDAYRIVRPDMLDIMSGTNCWSRKGKKDAKKVKQIMDFANKINKNEIYI